MSLVNEINKIKRLGKSVSELIDLQKWCLENSDILDNEEQNSLNEDISNMELFLTDIINILKFKKQGENVPDDLILCYAKEYDDSIDNIESSILTYKQIKAKES